MSRFERRLGAKSSSPRPGQAACKIPKKNNTMLSGFIDVRDKNNQGVNEVERTYNTIVNTSDNMTDNMTDNNENIKRVMNINNQLKKAMETITDTNIRLIYGHEIRLNTIELNVECLNEINCEKIYYSQKEEEKEQETINNLEKIEEIIINYNNLLIHFNTNEKMFNEKIEESNKNIEEERNKILDIKMNEGRVESLINDLTNKLDNIPSVVEEKIKEHEMDKVESKKERKNERTNERERMIINIENLKMKNEMLLNVMKKIVSKMDDSKDIIKEINKIKKIN